ETVQQVGELDQQWLHEYAVSEKNQGLVINLYRELMNATTKGGVTSPMYFDEKAYHRSDIYQVKDEVDQATEAYIKAKEEQAEVRDLKEKAEEEANKPWYEKTWDGIATFTGELTGYYDYKRTKEGIDPITGEKLSEADRVKAAAMAAAGFIPLIGWAGKAFKGGKAIYKTTKVINSASHALDTYKTTKTFDILQKTEMGLYGLASANGFGEYITGYDMFGNKLTEEQRQASFVQGLLGLGAGYITVKGADGVTKDATNLATDFKNVGKDIQAKGSQVIGDTSRALKLDRTDSLSFAGAKGITRSNAADTVQHVPKENLMMKAEGVGGVGKGIENVKQGDKSSLAPGGGLAAHELKGGHLIERHVGKTDEQLLERLKTNPKITGSSTFKDRMTAEKVANAVLSDSKNIEKIQKWLSDPNSRPTLPLKYKGDGEIIGRSVSRNSEVVENVTNAKIILKKNNDGSFILTGYPVK
uniref:RNase A-like domain-containing protein n=1 Tax=Bacillus sp. FJAT-47783 TaxID=2922712 RepID=UPI001FAC7E14